LTFFIEAKGPRVLRVSVGVPGPRVLTMEQGGSNSPGAESLWGRQIPAGSA